MTDGNTDGGPAYPQCKWKYMPENGKYVESISGGMTLRDWFAGQASEDDLDKYRDFFFCCDSREVVGKYTREQAKYRYADAMIAARGEDK